MADETEVQTENQEASDDDYQSWLASLEEDEEPEAAAAEEEADHEDDVALKVAKQTLTRVEKMERDAKIEKLEERFDSGASDDAKHILGVWRKGDESPEQLKKLMQLAEAKARETVPPPPEVDEDAVKKAAEARAQEAYGVGPVQVTNIEEDEWEKARQVIRKGDSAESSHAAFALWNALPGNGTPSQE